MKSWQDKAVNRWLKKKADISKDVQDLCIKYDSSDILSVLHDNKYKDYQEILLLIYIKSGECDNFELWSIVCDYFWDSHIVKPGYYSKFSKFIAWNEFLKCNPTSEELSYVVVYGNEKYRVLAKNILHERQYGRLIVGIPLKPEL